MEIGRDFRTSQSHMIRGLTTSGWLVMAYLSILSQLHAINSSLLSISISIINSKVVSEHPIKLLMKTSTHCLCFSCLYSYLLVLPFSFLPQEHAWPRISQVDYSDMRTIVWMIFS